MSPSFYWRCAGAAAIRPVIRSLGRRTGLIGLLGGLSLLLSSGPAAAYVIPSPVPTYQPGQQANLGGYSFVLDHYYTTSQTVHTTVSSPAQLYALAGSFSWETNNGDEWPDDTVLYIVIDRLDTDYFTYPLPLVYRTVRAYVAGDMWQSGLDDRLSYSAWLLLLPESLQPPPPPPPPPAEEDDMTDPQMAALFANYSANTAKVVASNVNVVNHLWSGFCLTAGIALSSLVAMTWKG